MKVPTPPAVGGGRSPGLSMCGFLAVVNSRLSPDALRLQTLTLQRLVRHRGPDGSGIHVVDSPDGQRCSSIAHERLAIVDPLSGNQPLFSHDRTRSLAVNGEIRVFKNPIDQVLCWIFDELCYFRIQWIKAFLFQSQTVTFDFIQFVVYFRGQNHGFNRQTSEVFQVDFRSQMIFNHTVVTEQCRDKFISDVQQVRIFII